jgi:DNA mismatch repair protein MutL
MPENRVAAGATILLSLPSRVNRKRRVSPRRERTASNGRELPECPAGYQKQQGALYRKLLETPAVERKAHSGRSAFSGRP